MFWFRKSDSGRKETIERLYGAIVAQARKPVFYQRLAVPDTVEGRFDLLVLHLFLVNERLAAIGEAGRVLGQELLDRFFEDMDASLREIGIGDLAVPKKMRSLAEAYLGRSASYAGPLKQGDAVALAAAIARNVFGAGCAEQASALAAYALDAAASLKQQLLEQFTAARVEFPDPERAGVDAK